MPEGSDRHGLRNRRRTYVVAAGYERVRAKATKSSVERRECLQAEEVRVLRPHHRGRLFPVPGGRLGLDGKPAQSERNSRDGNGGGRK